MTKEHEEKILSFAKGAKRRSDRDSKVKARRIRVRWPHFLDLMHAEFRTFVTTFNDAPQTAGSPRRPHVSVTLSTGSITAKSGRVNVTIASNLDKLTLMMIYKTRRSSGDQVSELPFWCRLGEDEEIEIHDSPDEDRMILLGDFVFRVLSPFFYEVIHQSEHIPILHLNSPSCT